MTFIADFHIHSKYSRATSANMDVEGLSKWAKIKGIGLLGTGDFTHPLWLEILKESLELKDNGLLEYKETFFILTCEVSNIFRKKGKTRKIHNLIFAPSFEVVEKINQKLRNFGNLRADGRATLALSARDLVELVLETSSECLVVPAHIWTPHFALFGSNSGFDSLEECFEDLSPHIYAIETGLSSDPAMNWRLSSLNNKAIISASDAHSPQKIGREACVFDTELSYQKIIAALKGEEHNKLLYTVEFFPEEGKYHYTGHRKCNILQSPEETKEKGAMCPVCGRKLTVGVMHRVEELADRPQGFKPQDRPYYKTLIPLEEIIGEAFGKQVKTKRVQEEYSRIIARFDNEFNILLEEPTSNLLSFDSRIAEGIRRVREGGIDISPGYDGVYGRISIFHKEEEKQPTLFG